MLPGIVDILADSELVFLAISSERFIILDTFTPAAGSNSLSVTTGPWLTFFILPLTPKSIKIFSKNSGSLESFFSEFSLSFFDGVFSKSRFGSLNFIFVSDLLSLLIKGKSVWIRFLISSCGIYSLIISLLSV